jgi:hypothetical protein
MKLLEPGANFIDVWSSETVYDYYTHDGRFVDRLAARKHIADAIVWMREFSGELLPQTSEAGHDHLAGWVDGATAVHLRVDNTPGTRMVLRAPCAAAERIPWIDAVYHDRFVLHGAGYSDRYASGQDQRLHGIYSDDYITTEVLTAHPPMVSDAFGRDVVRKYWLLHDLTKGLALRAMDRFEFAGSDIRRQHVSWEGGGEVWVNRGTADWAVEGHTLPQYGFYARVPSGEGPIEAAIERRDGLVIEWARSPGNVYANARPVVPEEPRRTPERGPAPTGPDPRLPRMNPERRAVSFGAVTTDGGVRLQRTADGVTLLPLPGGLAFTARIRWSELPWNLPEPTRVELLGEDGAAGRESPVQWDSGEIPIRCEPGVFAYRLR